MSFIKSLSSKKFLIRISVCFAVTLILAIGLFSTVLYVTSKNIFLDNEYKNSKKILNQLKYNIDLMNNDVKNLCKYLYINTDVTQVANSTGNLDYYDIKTIMDRLNLLIGNNSLFVDSICIYNSYQNQYFYGGKELNFDDQGLKRIFEDYPNVPRLEPISRTIKVSYANKVEQEKVFTYIVYETSGDKKQIDSAVVVNVKSSWLLDNLRILNQVDKKDGANVFVFDNKNNYIDDPGSNEMKAALKSEYLKHKTDSNSGIFVSRLLDRKYVVTYLVVDSAGFTLMKTQPYSEAYSYERTLKAATIAATSIFFFIALIVSLVVSRRLYKPLGNLVSIISANASKTQSGASDEISYLSSVYNYSMERLNYYDKEMHHYKSVLRANALKKILLEADGSLDKERYAELKEANMLTFPYNGPFVVCVMQIDNFINFQGKNDMKERELIRFALINIASELISQQYIVDGVDMKEDHVVLIVCLGTYTGDYGNKLKIAFTEALNYVNQYFKISFTVSISEMTDKIDEVSALYSAALNNSAYRMVKGKASIITPQSISENAANKAEGYSRSHEKKLGEFIRSKDIDGAEVCLLEIIQNISRLSYDNIIISLLHFLDNLKRMLEELLKASNEPINHKLPVINRVIFEYETLDDISNEILQSVRETIGNLVNEGDPNFLADAVATTAKDIIEKNYYDKGLCLSQISETMKLSSRRLSKVFKANMRISIPEYINEVRLSKSIEWMQKSDLTINEVVEKIGVENESYFYIMFKKRYGTSPKEYILKNNLKKIKV